MDHHVAVTGADHGDVVECLGRMRQQVGDFDAALAVFLELRLLPSSPAFAATNWYLASPNWPDASGRQGWLSSGLGSKVSRWLGPPAMNRKITDLAFALSGRLLPADWRLSPSCRARARPSQRASRKTPVR